MAARHHRTMEAGGWVLLAAAIAWLLWLLFHKNGQAMLAGGTVVSSTVGGVSTGPPTVTPNDPTQASTYVDGAGQQYVWNIVGKQWHPAGSPAQLSQGAFFV